MLALALCPGPHLPSPPLPLIPPPTPPRLRCVCGGERSPALAFRLKSICSFSQSSSGRVHVHSLSPLSRVRYICDALLDGTGEPQREPASSSSAVLASEFLRHALSGAQMLDAASSPSVPMLMLMLMLMPVPVPVPVPVSVSDVGRECRASGITSGGTGLRRGERGLRVDDVEFCRRSGGGGERVSESGGEEVISEAGSVGLSVRVVPCESPLAGAGLFLIGGLASEASGFAGSGRGISFSLSAASLGR